MRIKEHLLGAEAFARSKSSDGLDGAQRLTRALLLDELARYRDEGVFPKNYDSPSPRPMFVDAHGTRCAMAHLMELGGAGDLVAEVARENNQAYVEELARDARVVAWLRAAGLTVEEAARIQPQYCTTAASCFCNVTRDSAVWEGTVVGTPDGGTYDTARVDVVHRSATTKLTTGETRELRKMAIPEGTRLLIVERSPIATIAATVEQGDMLGATCLDPWGWPRMPSVSLERAVSLSHVDSATCRATLRAEDPLWGERICEGQNDAPVFPKVEVPEQTAEVSSSGSGCSLSLASSSPESVSVLLAVLSALAVRRAARRH
jgi:hypothetical protein